MRAKQRVQELTDKLLIEARTFAAQMMSDYCAARDVTRYSLPFAKWKAGCLNLVRLLGNVAEPWNGLFRNDMAYGNEMLGTLEAIKEAIDGDFLWTVEDLVMANVFSDLLEQSEYLLSKKMYLAAAVLARAVLEEHLRKWCERAGCMPTEPKPTIEHFKNELYAKGHLGLTDMKEVESMAASGNAAAHNKKEFKPEDAKRLVPCVRNFLTSCPL